MHFGADQVNQKWYGDGTEIVTDEGKLYLDSVLDMGVSADRRVRHVGASRHRDRPTAALAMAVAVRGGREAVAGVILHTDQGSEYTAHRFRAACARIGIRQSMGRPGSALDNAVIESWHSTLEFELRSLEHFTTRAQARAAVAAWIDDYNQRSASLRDRDAQPDRLRARRLTMTCTRPVSVVSSSPASRPSPFGVASGQP